MTDTLRVDICYRPLRVGWVIRENDLVALRQAVRYSYALAGGRFNPIFNVDRPDEVERLVESFRPDILYAIGESDVQSSFIARFPHLRTPFFGHALFSVDGNGEGSANLLDLVNTLNYWHRKRNYKFADEGFIDVMWDTDDPLGDVFLMQFGGFPAPAEVGTDYLAVAKSFSKAREVHIAAGSRLLLDIAEHPSLSSLCRWGMRQHYTIRPQSNYPGFFIGDAKHFADLVDFWNLRACDTALIFIDRAGWERYELVIPSWWRYFHQALEGQRNHFPKSPAVWSRHNIDEATIERFPQDLTVCQFQESIWKGRSNNAPMMYFAEASTLGVVGKSLDVPQVTFALPEKPFLDDPHFHSQHLVASVSLTGGLFDDEQHTFELPYVPELNEFAGRTMARRHDTLRIEPDRLGLVIDAVDHDTHIGAMPIARLVERIFGIAGFNSQLSGSGRIVRQLMSQLGGLQGGRIFKVPGARALLKAFGPRETFTRQVACNTIAGKSPDHPQGSFSAHRGLYIAAREHGTQLTPGDVFSFMVEKGIFRIGVNLECAKCKMESWISVDTLKQLVTCELCGNEYDATRQLVNAVFHFRRSGLLGAERNAQGAVPVALTLQQLGANIDGALQSNIYSASLDLRPIQPDTLPTCEVDFVWLTIGGYPDRVSLILGECKDKGPIALNEFQRDVENLQRVADAFPARRFDTFVLFAKLSPFTADEIAAAGILNSEFCKRVILLTPRELEPYHVVDRLRDRTDITQHIWSAHQLAKLTHDLYYADPSAESK